jgi:hypothetical protein
MPAFQLQAKDAVVRLGHYDALNSIQNLSWDSAMNTDSHAQLGDANFTAKSIQPEVTGSFEVKSTGAVASLLSRMIYTLNAGTGEFQGYLAGTNMAGLNTQLIRETDLQFAVFDLIESKKADEVFDRSIVIPRAHLSQIQISASNDGVATEQFSFEADLLDVYRKPFHDLVCLPVTRDATTPTVTIVTPDTTNYKIEVAGGANIATATHVLFGLYIGNIFVAATDLVPSWTTGVYNGKISLGTAIQTAGQTITLGDKLSLVVYRKTPGTFPTITYPTTARFVKADQIDIFMVSPTTTFTISSNTRTTEAHLLAGTVNLNDIPFATADVLLRVQSMDMSIPLQREALKEIRKTGTGSAVYFRAATFPLNVTSSVTLLESDLNEWAKIQGKDTMGADASPDILNLKDFEGKEYILAMRFYKAGVPIQTVALLNATVDGRGSNNAVGSRAGITYSFTGSKVAIQGK